MLPFLPDVMQESRTVKKALMVTALAVVPLFIKGRSGADKGQWQKYYCLSVLAYLTFPGLLFD